MTTIKEYGSFEEYLIEIKPKKAFVFGIGGGGDIIATLPTVNSLRTLGIPTIIGAVVWERWVVDPNPTPISINELQSIEVISDTFAIVNSSTYAVRNGRRIVPQIVRVARFFSEEMIAVDITKGVKGVIKGLREFIQKYQIDLIIGVDGGGDVLAVGNEKELWSPIADQTILAALANIDSSDILLAVFGIGTDGELPPKYILKRLNEIARADGYISLRGISRRDIKLFETILRTVVTETNWVAYKAALGVDNEIHVRGSSTSINLNLGILAAITVYLDPKIVYKQSHLARAIVNTESIWEIRKIFNDMGVFTEIDLKEGINKYKAKELEPDLNAIKEEWYKKHESN